MIRLLAAVLTMIPLLLPAPSAQASGWTWPLPEHRVDRDFAPPADEYGAGHRGVDLAGAPGTTVVSVAAGTVAFVGEVSGTPVVTVSHGAERSTYQPVLAQVTVGQSVAAGDPIGTLLAGHIGCGASACLHLGRIAGETYLDPLDLLGSRYRLIDPDGPPPSPPAVGDGTFLVPVEGAVTSGFGMRTHPVSGGQKMHDGVDFGAPCGTAVHASAAGTVRSAGAAGGYGNRLEIDHGGGVVTSCSHLQSLQVPLGATVAEGQEIARVGTTGTSTGCHLHFSVHHNGVAVDPAPML